LCVVELLQLTTAASLTPPLSIAVYVFLIALPCLSATVFLDLMYGSDERKPSSDKGPPAIAAIIGYILAFVGILLTAWHFSWVHAVLFLVASAFGIGVVVSYWQENKS
jgi:hypothetical protein